MKQMLVLLTLAAVGGSAMAQTTTVTFKPGAAIGEDASVYMMDNACIPKGQSVTPADLNYGNMANLTYMDWTFNSKGCPGGTLRSLFRFSQLSGIPTNAVILSATLKLYGVPSSGTGINSSYPGSPYPLTNPGWLSKVTSSWTETGVTWNTQPSTTSTDAISIPSSTLQWNWNWTDASASLVNMVQGWVSAPATNYGFQLRLQTEAHYRSILFASSDHTDSTLWPELTVTYEACDAGFTYCSKSSNPSWYSFTANDPGAYYDWTVDGSSIGTTSGLEYVFPSSGNYKVCLTKGMKTTKCIRCINLCIGENPKVSLVSEIKSDESAAGQERQFVAQGTLIAPDLMEGRTMQIVPNPASGDWDVRFEAPEATDASLNLYDVSGKLIQTKKVQVKEGVNRLNEVPNSLPSGVYFIEIRGDYWRIREKAVKL